MSRQIQNDDMNAWEIGAIILGCVFMLGMMWILPSYKKKVERRQEGVQHCLKLKKNDEIKTCIKMNQP